MSEPLDPKKYYIMSESTKKTLTVSALIFVFLVLPALTLYYYNLAIHRPSQLDKEISFEIKSGEGVAEIAKKLRENNAVNSEFLFALYVFLNKLDTNIQAGIYTIRAGSPLTVLVDQFQHGVNESRITFIEGWRVEEYAVAANKQFEKIDYVEFVKRAKPYEGYLFPDTYYFETDVQEDEMIQRMQDTFEKRTKDMLTPENVEKSGLTREQIIILASIVEREVNKEEDRPKVAGILINRFNQGMKLDADATTQYAAAEAYLCGEDRSGVCAPPLEELEGFNWWPKNLTTTDLEYDSPYNTRKSPGLPPTPISNPSLSAIRAVINYERTDNLYYLTDKFGKTHYAETLDGHKANIVEFLQ